MDSLERYAEFFDEAYPEYADARYSEIEGLVAQYGQANVLATVQSAEFARFVGLVRPLIAVKNYKSQVPFPEPLQEVLGYVVKIKRADVGNPDLFANHKELFSQFVALQGVQLATASAVFHFCHPDSFPIVDVKVKRACALLSERFPDDFSHLAVPILPAANTTAKNKLKKYREFIAFIDQVVLLQRAHGGDPDYRHIDKALMVLGVNKLRNHLESLPKDP